MSAYFSNFITLAEIATNKMKKLTFSLLLLAFATLLNSCGTQKTVALKPDLGIAKKITIPLSTINLPISVNCLSLENNINKQFAGVLYNDESFENNNNDNLIVKISKLADFKISGKGDKISITAPIEIYVKGRLKKDFFSMFDQTVGVDQSKDATFKINLTINSKIGINANWDVQISSETDFQWLEKPFLSLGLIKIPIGAVIETALNLKTKELNEKLDIEVSKLLKIKPTVEKYWNEFQQAQLINEAYKSYLVISPESISASKINCDGKSIYFYMGIKAGIAVVSGEKPIITSYKKLPNLTQQQKYDSSFAIYCKATIDYTQASLLANEALAGKTFTYENGKEIITINQINIFNNGDRVAAKINLNAAVTKGLFTKKINAEIYALGTPIYDRVNQELKITNFDFDIKSKNALVGATAFLFKSSFKKQIELQLAYPMKTQLLQAQQNANNALTSAKFEFIQLNGNIIRFEPTDILLEAQSIAIQLACIGKLTVEVKGF